MRLGVYSLQGLIADSGSSVREGALYAFTNRPRTLPRMVLFDGTGLYVHQAAGEGYVQLTAHSKPRGGRVGGCTSLCVLAPAEGHRAAQGNAQAVVREVTRCACCRGAPLLFFVQKICLTHNLPW